MNTGIESTGTESRCAALPYPLELPQPITAARIDELVSAGVAPDIARTDLEMVKLKLQHPEEGANWTKEQRELAELGYKRFLHLNRLAGKRSIVPTKEIDIFWHFHILDTRRYHKDSEKLFGRYFHHFPYFGMRGADDAAALERAFRVTEDLWRETLERSWRRPRRTAGTTATDGAGTRATTRTAKLTAWRRAAGSPNLDPIPRRKHRKRHTSPLFANPRGRVVFGPRLSLGSRPTRGGAAPAGTRPSPGRARAPSSAGCSPATQAVDHGGPPMSLTTGATGCRSTPPNRPRRRSPSKRPARPSLRSP